LDTGESVPATTVQQQAPIQPALPAKMLSLNHHHHHHHLSHHVLSLTDTPSSAETFILNFNDLHLEADWLFKLALANYSRPVA